MSIPAGMMLQVESSFTYIGIVNLEFIVLPLIRRRDEISLEATLNTILERIKADRVSQTNCYGIKFTWIFYRIFIENWWDMSEE